MLHKPRRFSVQFQGRTSRICGDRLVYAQALAAMEGLRGAPHLSLAASGGPLLARVRRILNPEVESMYRLPIIGPGAAVLIGSLMLASATAQPTGSSAQEAREPRAEERPSSVRDSHRGTVYVPLFRSLSFRRENQLLLTELVIKEIEKRTPCKVVGNIEDADTILEGTVNFTEKDAVVKDPFRPTRKPLARIEVTVHLMHNPPLDQEESVDPVTIGEAIGFVPEVNENSQAAFQGTCKVLATQIVDALERLVSRERREHPSAAGRYPLPSRVSDDLSTTRPASGRGRGPSPEAEATSFSNESERATARSRVGVQFFMEDPPSEEEVWDKVSKFDGVPRFGEVQRKNVQFGIEKIGEKVDPSKVYPLVGPCQLVHRHYKCTVTFDEWRRSDKLVPFGKLPMHHVEVIYIDKDYLRRSPKSHATP